MLTARSLGASHDWLLATKDTNNLITYDEFVAAVTNAAYPAPTEQQYAGLSVAAAGGGVSTRGDLAQFLAQILWESDGLQSKEDYLAANSPREAAAAYGGPGDGGETYHGRGYIQLTWADNYRAASQDLFGDDRLYQSPETVAQDEETAWAVSFWYWRTRVAVAPGYGQGFGATTKAINGALECSGGDSTKAEKRYEIYTKVAAALNEKPLGPEGCYS
ncbi:chitinase [Nocardia sp. NPDC050712]|uniref:chitinase n=1 Tax=Nocardia sp. NPDC050712 TaxID=3155518 RepID=UPI0033D46FE3